MLNGKDGNLCWLGGDASVLSPSSEGVHSVAQAEVNDFWVGLGLWLNVVSYHSSLSAIFCFFGGNHIFGMIPLQSIIDSVDSAGGLNVSI